MKPEIEEGYIEEGEDYLEEGPYIQEFTSKEEEEEIPDLFDEDYKFFEGDAYDQDDLEEDLDVDYYTDPSSGNSFGPIL